MTAGLLTLAARLDQVQTDIAARNQQAVAAGPGTAAWAAQLDGSASLAEEAARLQAVSAALTTATHDGPCGEDCGCTLIIDGTGLRLEVRMPGDAAGVLAAVVGLPDPEVSDAAHQP